MNNELIEALEPIMRECFEATEGDGIPLQDYYASREGSSVIGWSTVITSGDVWYVTYVAIDTANNGWRVDCSVEREASLIFSAWLRPSGIEVIGLVEAAGYLVGVATDLVLRRMKEEGAK